MLGKKRDHQDPEEPPAIRISQQSSLQKNGWMPEGIGCLLIFQKNLR
jgi:hypothetical protein